MTTRARTLAVAIVCAAAIIPYLPSIHDYFVQDDFGVVWLLSRKPWWYFPRWFVSTWMDNIWAYTPDEIRPFPALSYQFAAWWGAGSPVPNHVINIAFHAANALLVLAIARVAAGVPLPAATLAAVVFAVLPINPETVGWVTGRVDSMPAFFYLAAFLAYARWRQSSSSRAYVASVALFFAALFSKQNTVTLPVALVLYDIIVAGRPIRLSWTWMRPYVPFAVLTVGFLALRYVLFGEIARESRLAQQSVTAVGLRVIRHTGRIVAG